MLFRWENKERLEAAENIGYFAQAKKTNAGRAPRAQERSHPPATGVSQAARRIDLVTSTPRALAKTVTTAPSTMMTSLRHLEAAHPVIAPAGLPVAAPGAPAGLAPAPGQALGQDHHLQVRIISRPAS